MSTLAGIVLAAGEATRLPNKALLPIANGKIAIESAIEFCWRVECDPVIVVVDPSNIVHKVLELREHLGLKYVIQPAPYGVPDAIARASALVNRRGIITFCDNIYTDNEVHASRRSYAITRQVNSTELDGWDRSKTSWKDRDDCVKDWPRLAGYYNLTTAEMASGRVNESSIDFLNRLQVPAVTLQTPWWDIGTIPSYLEYLKEL